LFRKLGSWEAGKIGKREYDKKSFLFFLASQLLIFLSSLFSWGTDCKEAGKLGSWEDRSAILACPKFL
jgi:hypothetical protein